MGTLHQAVLADIELDAFLFDNNWRLQNTKKIPINKKLRYYKIGCVQSKFGQNRVGLAFSGIRKKRGAQFKNEFQANRRLIDSRINESRAQ